MKKLLILLAFIFIAGFFPNEQHYIPVKNATYKDWDPQSFWYSPWGKSGVHKGIDIFAHEGKSVVATTGGLVLYQGDYGRGGNVVFILGTKWRIHYYAHMQTTLVNTLSIVDAGEQIGIVGTTGNARGRPAHLHYSIKSLFPIPWHYGFGEPMAADKMFYLDPGKFIRSQ
ncbi:MAG TPA: M23 family metallopeptidase [Gammaproteobacteria bacterium]|nr:M23 family metallopeptidase [Gammaproteobacteria bacterium]